MHKIGLMALGVALIVALMAVAASVSPQRAEAAIGDCDKVEVISVAMDSSNSARDPDSKGGRSYFQGEDIDVLITFSDEVLPVYSAKIKLRFDMKTAKRNARYITRVNGNKTAVFSYKANKRAKDWDNNGLQVLPGTVKLKSPDSENGGWKYCSIPFGGGDNKNKKIHFPDHTVNRTLYPFPVFQNPENGSCYDTGESIIITMTQLYDMTLKNENQKLKLQIGSSVRNMTYKDTVVNGSRRTLRFEYVVQENDVAEKYQIKLRKATVPLDAGVLKFNHAPNYKHSVNRGSCAD